MKLVRYKTVEFYKERIKAMYAGEIENREENLKTIKKLFFQNFTTLNAIHM